MKNLRSITRLKASSYITSALLNLFDISPLSGIEAGSSSSFFSGVLIFDTSSFNSSLESIENGIMLISIQCVQFNFKGDGLVRHYVTTSHFVMYEKILLSCRISTEK